MRARIVVILVSFLVMTKGATDPAADARKRMSERINGGSTTIGPSGGGRKVVTTYLTYVSPLREWSAADGRTMQGRLVAFSAPRPGESGPVEVIRSGKVRLMRAGSQKAVDFPIENLSEDDQAFVKRVAEAAKRPVGKEESNEQATSDSNAE